MGGASEAVVHQQQQQLAIYKENLQGFVGSLKDCFSLYDMDHKEVVDMRTQIVNKSLLYKDLHLPVAKTFMSNLLDFMTNYTALTAEDFIEGIEEISQEAAGYNEQAMLVSALHTSLYKDSQHLVIRAQRALKTMELSIQLHTKRADSISKVESIHNNKVKSAELLAKEVDCNSSNLALMTVTLGASKLVGGVIILGTMAYAAHHEKKASACMVDRIAAEASLQNARKAADVIAGPMAECTKQFSAAIAQASQFFHAITTEVEQYRDQAWLARELKVSAESTRLKMKRHFLKMKEPAKAVIKMCKEFLSVAPLIEADLKVTARSNTNHQSYIRAWLERHQEEVELGNTLREGTRWHAIAKACNLKLLPPANLDLPEKIMLNLEMNNIHGAGEIEQTVSVQQVLEMASAVDSKAATTTKIERTAPGLKGSINMNGVATVECTAAARKQAKDIMEETHNSQQRKTQASLSNTVRLVAEPGRACMYTITLVLRGGKIDGNMQVKAQKI